MAGEFLRSHGIDIDAEMARIQNQPPASETHGRHESTNDTITGFTNVSLHNKPVGARWNVQINKGRISSISPHNQNSPSSHVNMTDGHGALLAPSLCHPHIHLDKAYLLSHPKYSHLQIEKGDFQEAMSLTGSAKKEFTMSDLLERGERVLDESVAAGVTHMRAFVEVDSVVGMLCLDAGLELKRRWEGRCVVQICAFAQLPLFSDVDKDEGGGVIRALMHEAAAREGVDVVGSTPYVEESREKMEWNVEWMIDLALENGKHLDFHLDYNLDPETEPLVWHVLQTLKQRDWNGKSHGRSIVLGHCTRLTLFRDSEWQRLKSEVGNLPVSFVGLPTSDLFMMRTPDRSRGTLDVPRLIKQYGLNACIGINNIGNAFTPQGSCDPLTLACNGIGVYQAGTKADAELLYEFVSTRARRAIGLEGPSDKGLEIKDGVAANVVLFGAEDLEWRTRKSVAELVYLYDHCRGRRAFLGE